MEILEFARKPARERARIFQRSAALGLSPLVSEKDFWVTYILGILFSGEDWKDRLLFKGGTTLSKVFGVTRRFSEDVDLSVDPISCGFLDDCTWLDEALEGRISKNQVQKGFDRIQKRCMDSCEKGLTPFLEDSVRNDLGEPETGNFFSLEIDGRTHSPVIKFHYPQSPLGPLASTGSAINMERSVKLELGALSHQEPVQWKTVLPYISELEDLESGEERNRGEVPVRVLGISRTFWEKATILHTEHYRRNGMRERSARDYYDVFKILESPYSAVADDIHTLDQVLRFKSCFFPVGCDLGALSRADIRLTPSEDKLQAVKRDYANMQYMFHSEQPPSFEEILERLEKEQQRFRSPENPPGPAILSRQ